MKAAVIVFPGSNREGDMARALEQATGRSRRCSGTPTTNCRPGTDLVVLPGGFSYGDYLRCGAIAGRAAIMDAVRAHAARGGLVLGRLQRLSDPLRERSSAGRADAQRQSSLRLQDAAFARRAERHRLHAPIREGTGDRGLHRAWRRQLRSRRCDDRAGRRRRAGGLPLLRRKWRCRRRRQSERFAQRHCGDLFETGAMCSA